MSNPLYQLLPLCMDYNFSVAFINNAGAMLVPLILNFTGKVQEPRMDTSLKRLSIRETPRFPSKTEQAW